MLSIVKKSLLIAYRRLPFTLLMEVLMLLLGIWAGTTHRELSAETRDLVAVGLPNLQRGRAYTLVTSAFFSSDALMYYGMFPFVAVAIGGYEWRVGTRRAVALYWGINVTTMLAAMYLVAKPLSTLTQVPFVQEMATTLDVGPSAGGFALIGASVNRFPERYRKLTFTGIMLYLIVRPFIVPDPYADIVHLIAFPAGFIVDQRTARQHVADDTSS